MASKLDDGTTVDGWGHRHSMMKILMETAALEQKGGRIHGSLDYNPFFITGTCYWNFLKNLPESLYSIYEIVDWV